MCGSAQGEEQFDFDSKNGKFRLAEAIDNFGEGHAYTRLVPELVGVDPDDAFSSVSCFLKTKGRTQQLAIQTSSVL